MAADVGGFGELGSRTGERSGGVVGLEGEALQALASRRINLAKIESRPSGESLGRYIFLVDVNGHRNDPPVAAALDDIRGQSDPEGFRIFGSYPRFVLK